jgi:hypothetical protein
MMLLPTISHSSTTAPFIRAISCWFGQSHFLSRLRPECERVAKRIYSDDLISVRTISFSFSTVCKRDAGAYAFIRTISYRFGQSHFLSRLSEKEMQARTHLFGRSHIGSDDLIFFLYGIVCKRDAISGTISYWFGHKL